MNSTPRVDVFDDFHLHGASAPEWQQRYLQLTPGVMRSTLLEARAEGVHVFRKWMSERVVQQGCLPAGQVCFALLLGRAEGTPRAQGRELHADSLLVLRGGEEFSLQRPRGMALLALTLDEARFLPWLESLRSPGVHSALHRRRGFRVPSADMSALRQVLSRSFDEAPGHEPWVADALDCLGAVLRSAVDERQSLASACASDVVARCQRRVLETPETPPSIEALSRLVRTSRRNLQDSFRDVAGSSPLHYLRSVRLNAVRHGLRSGATQVSDAALAWGFSHLGRFTQDYKALFGELPSRTLISARTPGRGDQRLQPRGEVHAGAVDVAVAARPARQVQAAEGLRRIAF